MSLEKSILTRREKYCTHETMYKNYTRHTKDLRWIKKKVTHTQIEIAKSENDSFIEVGKKCLNNVACDH